MLGVQSTARGYIRAEPKKSTSSKLNSSKYKQTHRFVRHRPLYDRRGFEERERERERQRQTDGQTDRWEDIQIDRDSDKKYGYEFH